MGELDLDFRLVRGDEEFANRAGSPYTAAALTTGLRAAYAVAKRLSRSSVRA